MTVNGLLQILIYLFVLILLVKPLGAYMARVYQGERTFLDRILGPVERLIYRLSGVDLAQEMNWKAYAVAMLLFNLLGLLAVYALQRFQHLLPLNPQRMVNCPLKKPPCGLTIPGSAIYITCYWWLGQLG